MSDEPGILRSNLSPLSRYIKAEFRPGFLFEITLVLSAY